LWNLRFAQPPAVLYTSRFPLSRLQLFGSPNSQSTLGRHAEAEAELAKLKAALGDAPAYQYAPIYAHRGQHS
jgi:hypothetical protein